MSGPSTDRPGISTSFFRNPHLLWLSIVVIVVGGVSAATSLPRLEDPRIVNRGPVVVTTFPGASAERVEALVTEPLEEALDEIDAIKDVESTSRAGVSVIAIELAAAVTAEDNESIFARIRDRLGEVASTLPEGAGEPVVDDERDPAAFTLVLGVSWTSDAPPLMGVLDRLATELADRLRRVDGTELVRVYGAPEEELTVEVDPLELAELGASPASLARAIAAADARRPAGVVRGERGDLLLEVEGELDSAARVARVPIATGSDGATLALGDVASIRRGWRTPESARAIVDGRPSVLVAARVSPDVRVDGWAARADAVLGAFERERAGTIRVDRVFEQEPYTTERLRDLVANLLAGAGVILLAVFLIMGLRPAIVVAFALPLVVALVLFGWQLTGGAIHQMSVFGLIIALGLLIDNAIVVTDEVASRRAAGASAIDAVGRSVRHLFLPLLASTATTILAFAPIMLLPGSAGDFVGSIGSSVVMAIAASFAVALTITAALAGRFVPPPDADRPRRWHRDGVAPPSLARAWRALLRRLFESPVAALALALALPLAGFLVAPTLGRSFFPPVDRDMLEVRVWLPSDAGVERTADAAARIEETLRTFDDVERVSWLVGGSFPSVYYNLVMNQDRAANHAHAIVHTRSAEATIRLLDRAQVAIDRSHPEAQVVVRRFAQGPPIPADVEYRVFGPSIETTREIGDRLRVALQAHPDVVHTQATMERGEPKAILQVDESAARLAGLRLADVADQLAGASEGVTAGFVVEDLERIPIRVRLVDAHRRALDAIASTPLVRPGGDRWTTASSLGEFTLRPEAGGVTRFDGRRTNVVKAYVRNGALPIDVSNAVLDDLERSGFALPAGCEIVAGGAAEQDGEATADLAAFAPVLATLMVAVLILAFRSVLDAALLGLVAACALGLALLSTWSIGFPISFNTILGTLGLTGVALNDSIVVLAAIRADPRASAGDVDALVETVAGATRHVVATTVTTIGGFLPLLLFVGGDFWPSLAIVLVGGIAGASLVALLLVPGVVALTGRGAAIDRAANAGAVVPT